MEISSALLTDFYQLSMAYGYWRLGMHETPAVFHVFYRRNPQFSRYVIATGLQTVIEFLKNFHFTESELTYLSAYFPKDFLLYLKTLRFMGDIDAMPEGTVCFSYEPLLRIQAPLLLCQLLETPLINAFNFASAVATMASCIRTLVNGDYLMEFGLRRAQGPDGGVTASRAAYVGGFDATSNVLAGQQYRIPVIGTMAHSWIMAFDDELTAFREYVKVRPDNVILLVDTYDTKTGVDHAIIAGHELRQRGGALKGVRLDSGDLLALSNMTRDKLDRAGFKETKIFASGDLSLKILQELRAQQAPIDAWGVGTQLSTCYEQPALDMVYKLGAIQRGNTWVYKAKQSDTQQKNSDPGILSAKRFQKNNRWVGDVIYSVDSGAIPTDFNGESEELLQPIFRSGQCVYETPMITETRGHCLAQVKQFHASCTGEYPVKKAILL